MAPPRRAVLELLLASLIWGAAFVVVDDLLQRSSPLTYLCLRFTLASLMLAVVFRRELRGTDFAAIRGGASLGLLLCLILALQAVGQTYTTPSKSAFITGLGIPLTPLFCWLLLRQRVTVESLAGLALAQAGFFVLAWPRGAADFNTGDLLTVGSAAAGALQIVYLGEYLGRAIDFRVLGALQIFFATIFLYASKALVTVLAMARPVAALEPLFRIESTPLLLGGTLITELIYLAGLATALVFILQARAQRDLTQTQAALIIGTEPVFAALISVLLGVEPATPPLFAGGMLMVAGMIVSQTRWLRRGGPHAPEAGTG